MTANARMGLVDPALRVLSELRLTLRDRSTLSPLARAVLLGTPVGELKKYKEHVDSVDESGRTPVRFAVELGALEVLKELIDGLGSNPDKPDADGLTPLHVACIRGDGEMVDVLLLKAKHPNSVDKLRGETPLIAACRSMNWELVERLMKMDVTHSDNQGRTALHWIMMKATSIADCIEAVNCLLTNQANINAQDEHGRAPLHFAAERGMGEACGLLVKRGAKLNITDEVGETPLHRCIIRPNVLQGKTCALQILLDLKADVSIRRQDGKTVEDLIASSLAGKTWTDSQKISFEVALRRIRKSLEVIQKG
jgi:ankyrin repeat protein